MSNDAAISYLKAKMRGRRTIREMLEYYHVELKRLEDDMNGLTSPPLDKAAVSSGYMSGAKSVRWYDLSEDKDKVQEQINVLQAEWRANEAYLQRAMNKFSEDDWKLLVRIYCDGEKIIDVADDIGYAESTLRKRLRRMLEDGTK